jgi:hypothetical protein
MADLELELNAPTEEDKDLFERNQQSIEVLHTLKVLAKIDTDKTIGTLIDEHPSTSVSIALTVVQNTNRIFNVLQASEISDSTKEVLTVQNIAMATVVGMMLRSMAHEAELKAQISLLTNAMFEATNYEEEILH